LRSPLNPYPRPFPRKQGKGEGLGEVPLLAGRDHRVGSILFSSGLSEILLILPYDAERIAM
jgi:hypothetical protein